MSIVTLNDRGVRSVSAFGSVTGLGNMIFIKKLTASSSGTLSFVNGSSDVVLDSTYKEYVFTFNNVHPQTSDANFTVGFRDGGTDYDAVKTTSYARAYHDEADSGYALEHQDEDLDQSTDFHKLTTDLGAENDEGCSGFMHFFNPASTAFAKHFISDLSVYSQNDYNYHVFTGGYVNTTTAIDGVQFKMHSGNIDAGDICLYGIL
jgi:hypothetical protein